MIRFTLLSFTMRFAYWGVALGLTIYLSVIPSAEAQSKFPLTMARGSTLIELGGGTQKLDHEWSWTANAVGRVGLTDRVELFLPLAISYRFVGDKRNAVALTVGVTDFWITPNHDFLWTPALVVSGKFQLSSDAATLISADYTHIQSDRSRSPGYLRGAFALMVDMGPYLSWCVGFSYQRILVSYPEPSYLHHSGLASPQRISIGSVRATPFGDAPLFLIRTGTILNFTIHAKLDIDTDSDTTDARFLGGMQLVLPQKNNK